MKQIVCQEPGRLVEQEVTRPHANPGEALVRIRRVGVCGTDIHAYGGRQPFFTYPRVLGHELAAEVMEVNGQSEFVPGESVTILPYFSCGECIACRNGKSNCCTSLNTYGVHVDGGMQEYVSIPIQYLVKGENLSLDQLATVECLGIGAHAVRRANLSPNEHVLVIGAGPIGLGVMKFAKLAGATVTALDINEERLQFCQTWANVNHTVLANDSAAQRIFDITGGDNPTAVFDATGNPKSMMGALQYMANGGRLIYVGLVQADITFHDPEFHRRETTMMSSRNATREDFRTVMNALSTGAADASTFITHRASIDEVTTQFDSWTKPETGVIKAMIEL